MSRGRGHAVKFYDHVDDVVGVVARFAGEGFDAGETMLVVATPEHREGLLVALRASGSDPDRRVADGELVLIDAAQCLAGFLVDGRVDRLAFRAQIGAILQTAAASGRGVRAFGEMVMLLCAADDITGAIELETFWEELVTAGDLTLLCSYATSVLDTACLTDVSRLCALHSEVLTPRPTPSFATTAAGEPHPGHRASEVFLPAGDAVAAARRFVTGVLGQWGEPDLVDDAVMVVSEMAGNAVTHGDSPFRATVDRSALGLRVTVEDLDGRWPQRVAVDTESLSGRGMVIVEALSSRWGCESRPVGKAVWADLPVPVPLV